MGVRLTLRVRSIMGCRKRRMIFLRVLICVRAPVDSGSNRFSFISPSGLRRLALLDRTRKWAAQHTVAGAQSVVTDKCVDVLLRFEEAEVAVTSGVMELPVDILLGMDLLSQLGGQLDLPAGVSRRHV